MSDISQATRAATLHTPLKGQDELVFSRIDATEALNEAFEFRIDALSRKQNIDFDKLLGEHCHVKIDIADRATGQVVKAKTRCFSGILVEAQWLGLQDSYFAYRLVLRPWFWLLSQTTDCRIFHNQTPKQILETVLTEDGLGPAEFKIQSFPKMEHCVQYRETKFAFASRLMEEFGIAYHFEHKEGSHVMVLTDENSKFKAVEGTDRIPFVPLEGQSRHEFEHISHWLVQRRFRPGKFVYRDYDYDNPDAKMEAESQASEKYQHAKLELFDYPGRYKVQGDGQTLAKIRIEAEQSLDKRRMGSGDALTLYPGGTTTLYQHPSADENGKYVVTRVSHSYISQQAYRSGAAGGGAEHEYAGQYEFQPADRPYKPPLVTPKPTIFGPQTAKVVGEDGQEIDVDDEGRILLKFHWDRKSEHLHRVRVAQVWAGKSWGGVFIPRIGQEVVVEFLEGDVDRPLVVGTVYNGKNTMPFGNKPKKTINGIKSDSSMGGGGFNHLIMDDEKGKEKVDFQAQKHLNLVVLDAETREVGEKFTSENGPESVKTTIKMGDELRKIEAGKQTVDVAQDILITSKTKITLKVGDTKIELTPLTIDLKTTFLTIKADGTAEMKSPLTTVKGDGILTLKGGLTLIN